MDGPIRASGHGEAVLEKPPVACPAAVLDGAAAGTAAWWRLAEVGVRGTADILVVGAGPAGLALALQAHESLRCYRG